MWALSTPCLRAAAGGTVLLCSPGDPSCPPGSDLQSSHCTLGEAFEDLDWETEKGLEAVACDTEGFVPPKVMVRLGRLPCSYSSPSWAGGGGEFLFLPGAQLALPACDTATRPPRSLEGGGGQPWGPPTTRGSQAAGP